jgi:hypothetical protein
LHGRHNSAAILFDMPGASQQIGSNLIQLVESGPVRQ